MSLLDGLRLEVGGPLIAGLGLTGTVVALAMTRGWGRGLSHLVLLGFGWLMCATLLLVVPDARVLALLGCLPALIFELGFEAVDWPILNQVVCLAGGFAWGAAALAYGREHHEWSAVTAAVVSGSGPRWGTWATYAAAALPLPYAASRLAWALGIPVGLSEASRTALEASDATVGEVSLSGMALGLATLAYYYRGRGKCADRGRG